MFCQKCGHQLADTAAFCAGCGAPTGIASAAPVAPAEPAAPVAPIAPVEPAAPVAPVAPVEPVAPVAPVEPVVPVAQPMPQYAAPVTPAPKKKKTGLIVGIIAIVLALAVAAGAVWYFFIRDDDDDSSKKRGASYGKVIDYMEEISNGDFDNFSKLVPEEVWEDFLDMIDMDEDECIEYYDELFESERYDLESELGDNIKISYTVTDENKLDDDDLDDIKADLEEYYGIDEDDVTEAYELEVTIKRKGSEDSEEEDDSLVAIKIDGKWYPYINDSFVIPSTVGYDDYDDDDYDSDYDSDYDDDYDYDYDYDYEDEEVYSECFFCGKQMYTDEYVCDECLEKYSEEFDY